MGNQCCSCKSSAAPGDAEAIRKNNESSGIARTPQPGPRAANGMVASGGGGSDGGPVAHAHRSSPDFHSAGSGPSDTEEEWYDAEEEWYDAVSEVDLAEALEQWEEQQHTHTAEVDRAIQVGAAPTCLFFVGQAFGCCA